MPAQYCHHGIHPAIIVQVSKGQPAPRHWNCNSRFRALETSTMIQGEQGRLQIIQGMVDGFDVVQHMTLGDEQVLPAVVVEVFHANAPSGTAGGERAEAGFKTLIGERASAIVVVEAIDFAGQLGNDDVGLAVVIVVLKDSAHAGKRLAIGGERGARFESALRERAVAVVVEEELLHAVVGDEDVREAVVVIVGEGHAKSAALLGGDAGFLANVLESAVAAIAIEKVSRWGKFARRAIGSPGPTAGLAVPGVPFHVTGHKEIEMAVIVEVEKTGRDGPAAARDSRFGGDIREGSVAVVVIQDVLSVARDEEIGIAIIVVVADRDAHAVVASAGAGQACGFSHIRETAIFILAIKAIPVARIGAIEFLGDLHGTGYAAAIDQKDVE